MYLREELFSTPTLLSGPLAVAWITAARDTTSTTYNAATAATAATVILYICGSCRF